MKKNKNGFTLIEMLVTIAVLATLSVVVGLSITGMLGRQKEKKYETYMEDLEKAGCVYAQKENWTKEICAQYGCEVGIDDILTAGLIRKDITNPQNGESIEKDTCSILVSFENDERICSYSCEE